MSAAYKRSYGKKMASLFVGRLAVRIDVCVSTGSEDASAQLNQHRMAGPATIIVQVPVMSVACVLVGYGCQCVLICACVSVCVFTLVTVLCRYLCAHLFKLLAPRSAGMYTK